MDENRAEALWASMMAPHKVTPYKKAQSIYWFSREDKIYREDKKRERSSDLLL